MNVVGAELKADESGKSSEREDGTSDSDVSYGAQIGIQPDDIII